MPFDRVALAESAASLARAGVYVGTSSWKYPGWRGMLYESARYEWRGRFAESRFERNCLAEYGEVFKTVCVDATYYALPTRRFLDPLAAQVPGDFRFGLKVTEEITVKKFTNLPRFGIRAGKLNDNFLNANLFASSFLGPCEAIRPQVGVVIFEFSRFHPPDYAHGRDFLADLDAFLGRLPGGWPYAVELRNPGWLQPDYFACLAKHRVAHVFNSWEAMPPVSEQMTLAGSRPRPGLVPARFLLKPGRKYDDAVKLFAPYDKTKEVNEEARRAARRLVEEGKDNPGRQTFIYINNRLEGNALETIAAILGEAA